MNNGQIFDFVNTILRKEKSGSAVSPERFTLLLLECMWEKLNVEFGMFERSQVITDTIRSLKVTEDISVTASSDFDITTLSEDYLHPTTMYYTYTGRVREIDIVTDAEWSSKLADSLMAPTDEFPIAKIFADTIFFNPIASETVTFTYLKKPEDPFYDYYYDANDRVVYLLPGTNYTLQAGEEYRDGTTVGLVSSISVELPFPEHERVDVAYKILQKFGITVREEASAQYGIQREAKEESL